MLTLQEHGRAGLPLHDTFVLDVHGHFGGTVRFDIPDRSPEQVLTIMNRVGIDVLCVSHLLSLTGDNRRGNDLLAQALRDHPGRFVGYAVANPHHANGIERELDRCFDKLGFSGIKTHHYFHDYPTDGEGYERMYRWASRRGGVPILGHSFGDACVTAGIARRYPNVPFIIAHIGGEYHGRWPNAVIDLARELPNVYLDLCSTLGYFGGLEALVERVGPDKILYASDMNFQTATHQIGRVLFAAIAEADKRKILGMNAARLFGIEPVVTKSPHTPAKNHERLTLFDANCALGAIAATPPGSYDDAAGLLRVMDRAGVDEALVYHSAAEHHDAALGNELLLNQTARQPRLHPCWVVLPNHTGELAGPEALLGSMANHDVRCVRLFPNRIGPLRPYAYSDLLQALNRAGMVMLLDLEVGHYNTQRAAIDWDGLDWLLGEHPRLAVVLPRAGQAMDRTLIPFLHSHPNLHIEMSYYVGTGGLERLCERVGAERVLFGTGLPRHEPGTAITLLTYSALDDRSKRLVAGENLRRLLSLGCEHGAARHLNTPLIDAQK